MIKQAITILLLSTFAVMGMEIDDQDHFSPHPTKAGSRKIEIVTDINKKNSYTVAVSLCIRQSDRSEFA